MSDIHFAELARDLKHNNGFVNWSVIVRWYNKHYVYVNEDKAHYYIDSILHLISDYVTRHGLINVSQLVEALTPRFNSYTVTFTDLSHNYNDKINYRILATICSKLILTEVKKIPHYNEL